MIGVVVIGVVLLLLTGRSNPLGQRKLNERISLRRSDKIPYGTYVAYNSLSSIFPNASVFATREEPASWDSLSVHDSKQALIIICPEFNANSFEIKNLVRFAESGNDVFISTMDLSYDVTEILNCNIQTSRQMIYYSAMNTDTLLVSLANPPFETPTVFEYPGKQYDGYFSKIDTSITTVLGHDRQGRPDFIHVKADQGNIYVHLAPMAFTNYFILHRNNVPYYEKALSLISPDTKKIAWDEYFYYKPKSDDSDPPKKGWLSSLLSLENADDRPVFLYAFLLGLALLLLYVLMEMRRKQRHIPIVKKPINDSLDFVKTIGRLYHDKGDHHNLARKMSAYFLEHVRNRYKLPTNQRGEEFINNLHAKTGIEREEIGGIVSFISQLDNSVFISAKELASFHKQLESFYKKV